MEFSVFIATDHELNRDIAAITLNNYVRAHEKRFPLGRKFSIRHVLE